MLPVTWPGGCLGIYTFNTGCTAALVPGWVVVVSDGERSWVYHTAPRSALLNPALSEGEVFLQPLPEIDWPTRCWDDEPCNDRLSGSGLTQVTPVIPKQNNTETWVFENAATRRWFDSPITPGFKYAIAGDGYFSDILDFPIGIDADSQFTVTVGDQVLGEFSPGERVNFLDLLGSGVKEFTVSDIEPLIDASDLLAFPLQLGFTTPVVDSFTVTPLLKTSLFGAESKTETIPEPSLLLGTLLLGTAGLLSRKLTA